MFPEGVTNHSASFPVFAPDGIGPHALASTPVGSSVFDGHTLESLGGVLVGRSRGVSDSEISRGGTFLTGCSEAASVWAEVLSGAGADTLIVQLATSSNPRIASPFRNARITRPLFNHFSHRHNIASSRRLVRTPLLLFTPLSIGPWGRHRAAAGASHRFSLATREANIVQENSTSASQPFPQTSWLAPTGSCWALTIVPPSQARPRNIRMQSDPSGFRIRQFNTRWAIVDRRWTASQSNAWWV